MGDVIVVNPSIIRPTEIDIREESLRRVFEYYSVGRQEELGPPAVRRHYDEYYTLDGHHRLAVADMLGLSIPVYLANDFGDFMRHQDFSMMEQRFLDIMNEKIELRFDYCIYLAQGMNKEGVSSFYHLRQRYGFLNSASTLEEYLKKAA